MKIGEKKYGFRVDRVRRLDEIDASLFEMTHEKTGAQLCFLDRKDENKTFSIAFKTLPSDSTGVFHILEHSVLCGSDKFPVKEPFVDLLKTSVQTFLNALTYPDKTVYPVSSRNDRDLLNLMEVYLDAVFHPAIYQKSEIFRQEGWRYEETENGPTYQGVVLNEMKGAFSSPESVLEYAALPLLFPDNCYRHVSGGDPEHIPDLTVAEFLENHRKFYHPSNARISLCGSVDLSSALPLIDRYLSGYEKKEVDFSIPMQKERPLAEKTLSYEIAPDETEKGKTVTSFARLLCPYDDRKTIFAAFILADFLADDNESPLKRAVLKEGVCEDFRVSVSDGLQQVIFSWEAWNTDPDKIPVIRKTVRDTVKSLCEKGLDRASLTASYNHFAFRLRDRDGTGYPRSLGEALTMLDSWLYGGDPALPLLVEDVLSELEKELSTRYFETLLSELFLNEKTGARVTLIPSASLGAEKREKEEKRVKKEAEAWTAEDRARLKREAESLKAWQQTPDAPEDTAKIPVLKLSDLAAEPEKAEWKKETLSGVPVLRHETARELTYLNLYFNASSLDPDSLSALSLLSDLTGRLATASSSAPVLQQKIKSAIGKFSASVNAFPGSDPDHAKICFSLHTAFLPQNLDETLGILREILTETAFDDPAPLAEMVKQEAMDLQMELSSAGHRFAITRAGAEGSAQGAVKELTDGFSYAKWLKEMGKKDDLSALSEALSRISKRVFVRENLTLSTNLEDSSDAFSAFLAALPSGERAPEETYVPVFPEKQEGVVIPAGVGFAGKSVDLRRIGIPFHGAMLAMANVLNYQYLWSEIRVQGGAYGCGFSARGDGEAFFYTYRDPKPERSLKKIEEAPAFLEKFLSSSPDLTGPILASVSSLDPLLSAEAKITLTETRYFRGTAWEEICRNYRELLSAAPETLSALLPALRAAASSRQIAVFAGEKFLDACGDQLKETISL